MKRLQDYCINERRTIKEAISLIQRNLSRCIVVMNDDKKVTGVFCEGDILRAILQDIKVYAPLKKVVRPSFHYLNEKDMSGAFKMIKKYGITMIPVIDADFYLKDVITIFDVMDHLAFIDNKDE